MRALAMVLVVGLPSVVWAQTPKGLRVEVGWSDNHRGMDRSAGGAVRGFAAIDDRGLVSVEGGMLIGKPYLGVDAGVDARFPAWPRTFVLVRGGAGVLLETNPEGYFGFWRYGGGVELLLTARNRMAITYQRGSHESTDTAGPHLLMVGLEHRFGRR